jgi:hypothetical protein
VPVGSEMAETHHRQSLYSSQCDENKKIFFSISGTFLIF